MYLQSTEQRCQGLGVTALNGSKVGIQRIGKAVKQSGSGII